MQEFREELCHLLKWVIREAKTKGKMTSTLKDFPVEISKIIQNMNVQEYEGWQIAINGSVLKKIYVKNIDYSLGQAPYPLQMVRVLMSKIIQLSLNKESLDSAVAITKFSDYDFALANCEAIIEEVVSLKQESILRRDKLFVLDLWSRLIFNYLFPKEKKKKTWIIKDWELVVLKD